jgi:drug/metabolite transporter (DMT)-like permease
MRRIHADLLLLACAAVWGLSFLFQKSAMSHIGPLTFVAARGLVAALVLLPFVIAENRRAEVPIDGRLLVLGAWAGGAFLMGGFLQQSGLETTSVINTGFLTALYVVATPLVGFLITRRAIEPVTWPAVVLSFVGLWLLGGGTLGGFAHGDLLVAASTVFWALHFVLAGLAAPLARPALFTALVFVIAGLLGLVGAFLTELVSAAGLRAAALDILYVGVVSGALTFTLLTIALRATTPTEAAIVISTDTIFAALGAWIILGERMTATAGVGAVAILAAVLLVQTRGLHRADP